jgi:NADH-quinone oxidoreductase subunit H
MVTVSALAATLFLGGWLAPWPISLWADANTGWWPVLWWLMKVMGFIFIFIWLRGTLPRMRYDQFMKFGWKILIPASVVWIVVVAAARAFRDDFQVSNDQLIIVGVIIIGVLLLASWITQKVSDAREKNEADDDAGDDEPFDPMAGGFPVPPMPGQELPPTPRRTMVGATPDDSRSSNG